MRVTGPEPGDECGESTDTVRARVVSAVERQRARYADWPWSTNAHVAAGAVNRLVPLATDAADAWRDLIETRVLTGRGAARVRRVARTIADLDGAHEITAAHVETAALLRSDVP
jgi:magnesium chelatase family protein